MGVVRAFAFLALLALASATYSTVSYAPTYSSASYVSQPVYSYGSQYTSTPYYGGDYSLYGNYGSYGGYGSYGNYGGGSGQSYVYYPVAVPTPGFGNIANNLNYANDLFGGVGGGGFGGGGFGGGGFGGDSGLLLLGAFGLLLILLANNNNNTG